MSDDFPTDPFTGPEKLFIERLTEWVFQTTGSVRSTGEDVPESDVRSDIACLIGDREELADAIQAVIDREYPYNDLDETSKGVYATLHYLFGPEGS